MARGISLKITTETVLAQAGLEDTREKDLVQLAFNPSRDSGSNSQDKFELQRRPTALGATSDVAER
jgi:hypothetical protein